MGPPDRSTEARGSKRSSKGTLNVGLIAALDDESDNDADNPEPLSSYLVDNTVLCHPGRGLGFRASPSIKDNIPEQLAEWGSVVVGRRHDDDWIKIGSKHPRYLPVKLQNVSVLKLQGPAQATTDLVGRGKRPSKDKLSLLPPLQNGSSNLAEDSGPPAPASSMLPGALGKDAGMGLTDLAAAAAELANLGDRQPNVSEKEPQCTVVVSGDMMRGLNMDNGNDDDIPFLEGSAVLEPADLENLRKLPRTPCVTKVFSDSTTCDSQGCLPATKLGSGCRICILGSERFRDSANESLVKSVAKGIREAVGETAVVVTSGESGVQKTFAEAFGAETVVNLVPKGHKSTGIGKDIIAGESPQDVMAKMKSVGHLYLTFEGDASCAEIAKAASERGAFVLPLIRTAGASGGVGFPDFPASALKKPSFVAEAVWSPIRDPCSGYKQVAAAMACIIGPLVAGINLMSSMAPSGINGVKPPPGRPEGAPGEVHPRTRHSLLGCEALQLQASVCQTADSNLDESDPFSDIPAFKREKDSAALKAPSCTMMFSASEQTSVLDGLSAELAAFQAHQDEEEETVAPQTGLSKDELRTSNTVMTNEIAELRAEIDRRRDKSEGVGAGASAA